MAKFRMVGFEKVVAKAMNTPFTIVQDTRAKTAPIYKFVDKVNFDVATIYYQLTLKTTLLLLAEKMADFFKEKGYKASIKSTEFNWLAVECERALIIVNDVDNDNEDYAPSFNTTRMTAKEPRTGIFGFTLVGDIEILGFLQNKLAATYENEQYPRIRWWYEERGRDTYLTTYLENPNTVILPELYPNLDIPPDDYIAEYLSSKASVLLLWGPPGTGKTTLLRHMIYKHKLTASVIYDEGLMRRDAVFQSFLFDKNEDVLIIEDADIILSSREMAGNRLMNRFLNVSDGLIKLPDKKLIFTTNLTDFSKVDEALIRPGRCFDILETRMLTFKEALKAAEGAGLQAPLEDKEYTVAELFNSGSKVRSRHKRKIGFA